MSAVGVVPKQRFENPLPHTPLNHFLKKTKSLLESGALDNEDAVFVVTSPTSTLDQAIAAIVFAYLQQNIKRQQHTQFRYIPVISNLRSLAFEESAPELPLALQTALIAQENLIFEDDPAYKTVNAYTSKKKTVLVGGAVGLTSAEAWNQWQDLHGAEVFGAIDVQNTLPLEMHNPSGTANEQLSIAIFPPETVQSDRGPRPSLASMVALWAKEQIQQNKVPDEDQIVTREVADLLLSAILLQTENIAEASTSPLDLGAVGWLNPRSSFQLLSQDSVSVSTSDADEETNSDEDNVPSYDPYVPTFSDLDALYRALRAASKKRANPDIVTQASSSEEVLADSSHYEWNLITNSTVDDQEQAPVFVNKTILGDFAAQLQSDVASKLLQPIAASLGSCIAGSSTFNLDSNSMLEVVSTLLTSTENSDVGFEVLCVAISALHAFVQVNWTGPDLHTSLAPSALLRSAAPNAFPPRSIDEDEDRKVERETDQIIHRASLEALAFKGEPAYHLCQAPFLFVFAKHLLETLWTVQQKQASSSSRAIETLSWWRLRVSTVHSHILDEPVAFGKKVFDPVQKLSVLLKSRATLSVSASEGRNAWAALASRLLLERGIALQRLGNDREASEGFVEAAKTNGLRYQMSGALGKRTKFQKEDKTQLVLLAKSAKAVADTPTQAEEATRLVNVSDTESTNTEALETGYASKANPSEQVAGMPSTFALNDDLLLEQTKFTSTVGSADDGESEKDLLTLDPNAQPALAVLDQCILLALCLNIRNTQPAHGLTANQMQVFVSRVVSHPQNWMVHTMSLLLRARLESTRTRTIERSVLQLQALIDQMPTNDSSIQERLRYSHTLDLAPKWEMQSELARRYASIGVTRSALEIYERIELWEEVVQCLGMLGRQEEGVEVVKELLEGKKIEADVDISTRRRRAADSNENGTKRSEAQAVMYQRLDKAREAKLWCLLGDLEPNSAISHYTKAWQISFQSSPRAARSLGGVHFASENFGEAAKWLKEGLRLNPLYTRSWFLLGCCYMRLEKWKDGAQCFRRCTALDDEDAESWNNLASCYLRMVDEADQSTGRQAANIERMALQGTLPDILEAEEEADRMWDHDTRDLGSESDWSGSSRSDSGVELSSSESGADTASDTDTDMGLPDPGANVHSGRAGQAAQRNATSAFSLKLLAHRSLEQSLRFAHDNWRVWYNYMVVCVNVGLMLEAARAMVRVTELQTKNLSSDAAKAATVDLAVLSNLVSAVTQTPKAELEDRALAQVDQYEATANSKTTSAPRLDSNSGLGLYPAIRRLFDETLLARISSSPAIWKLYSRLLTWNDEYPRAVQHALLTSYNLEFKAAFDRDLSGGADLTTDKTIFIVLLHDLRNVVDRLLDLSERNSGQTETLSGPKPDFQARTLVRSFLAKTKPYYDGEPEYEEAKELLEQLKT